MNAKAIGYKVVLACATAWLVAASAMTAHADTLTPKANEQVRFPEGGWSAVPQTGPDGKVRQCVLVADRTRAGDGGAIETRLSLLIGRGAGFAFDLIDEKLPPEQILDDQAEVLIDGKVFPAVAFTLGPGAPTKALGMHPGDATGALAALGQAKQVTLRSAGVGIDSGPITLQLPGNALDYLKRCGETFKIAIDRPTDPDAPEMPKAQPRSPRVLARAPTTDEMQGSGARQRVSGWDASEIRAADGSIAACYIRRVYSSGSGANRQSSATALMADRDGGLRMALRDTTLNMTADQPLEATLTAGGTPLDGFVARVASSTEIDLLPAHGEAFAASLAAANEFDFKSKAVGMEFVIHPGVVGWLRACARRSDIAIEPPQKAAKQ